MPNSDNRTPSDALFSPLLRAIVENSPDGVVLVGENLRILYASGVAEWFAGEPISELITPGGLARIHPLDLATVREAIVNLRGAPGMQFSCEFRCKLRDDSWIWIQVTAVNFLHEPNVRAIVANCRDITSQKLVQAKLRTVEVRSQKILDCMFAFVGVLTPDGTVSEVNRAPLEAAGLQREDVLGKHFADTYWWSHCAETRARVTAAVACAARGKIVRADFVILASERREMVVDATFAPLCDGAGQVVEVVVSGIDVTHTRQTEEARVQSEAQLRATFEGAAIGIAVVNTECRLERSNPALSRLLGYSQVELVGMSFAEFSHPDDLAADLELFHSLLHGERSLYDLEKRYIHKDGRVLWGHLTVSLVRRGDGMPPVAIGMVEDISERKDRERRIQEQARLLDLAHDAIMTRDLSDRIRYWNFGAESLFGWSAAEVIGTDARTFLYKNSRAVELAKAAVLGSGAWDGELTLLTKDSREIIVRGSWTLLRDETGKPESILVTQTDITEQKKAELAIRQSESRLRALVASMDDMAFEFDLHGVYREIWTVRDELLVRPRAELIGMSVVEVFGPEIGKRFLDAISWVAESRCPKTFMIPMEIAGVRRKFLTRVGPIIDEGGFCERVCILSRDVTEQELREARFLHAQRLESIGTLASGVAHDLNNILAPILMATNVLRVPLPPEEFEKIVALIETSAERGAMVVKQVLTFARGVEGEKVVLQPKLLAKDMARIAAETFPRNITVQRILPADLWNIEGDATQLHQVLLNLCVNARDAMPNGGTLSITAENFEVDENYSAMRADAIAGNYVLIKVSDTGAGIPASVMDKIFDPFFTTKELGKGTGLGLSTVLGIVKSHGGFLNVLSQQGLGATFEIFLPATTGEVRPAPIEETITAQGHGEKILVVDDENGVRRITQMMLEKNGYQVMLASDGAEAIALYVQNAQDIGLVLTDVMMPVMDGVALARGLRRLNPNVHIIASTGQIDEPRKNELRALGVDVFLKKPYTTAKLLNTLREMLANSPEVPLSI